MSLRRTFLLWVALIVGFVALYQLMGSGGHGRPGIEVAPRADPLGVYGTLAPLVFLLFFGVALWRARRINRLSVRGVALLGQGRYLEALGLFEQVLRKQRRSALAAYNVGLAQLGLWRVAEAEASFDKAARMGHRLVDVRALLEPCRALTAALLARDELARTRLSQCGSLGVEASSLALLARAVLAARACRWAEAQELLARSEVRMLSGPSRGLAEALQSWAIERQGGVAHPVDRLGLFFEAGQDAFKAWWPEFHEFLLRAPAA